MKFIRSLTLALGVWCFSIATAAAQYAGSGRQPLWMFRAGAVFLDREAAAPRELMFDNLIDRQPTLNAADFHFPSETGWEFDLTRALSSQMAVEIRYLSVDQWSAKRDVASEGAYVRYRDGTVLGLAPGAAPIQTSAEYDSQLQNYELNARLQPSPWLTFIAGLRYLELDERLAFELHDPSSGELLRQAIRADNDLYGLQMGVEFALFRGKQFRIDTTAKGGLYANHAGNHFHADQRLTPLDFGHGDNTLQTALQSEIVVLATYQLTQCWALQGGYHLLWISDVAVASEQPSASDPFATPAVLAVDNDTNLFYHGAQASVVLSF